MWAVNSGQWYWLALTPPDPPALAPLSQAWAIHYAKVGRSVMGRSVEE
jgi:hypothetical protein